MVTIVERLATEIRSGPVRAIFPQGGKLKNKARHINQISFRMRQSYSQPRCASRGRPFRSSMNNYWMTNNAMELTASRRTIQLHMTKTLKPAAKRALARGSSSCSR